MGNGRTSSIFEFHIPADNIGIIIAYDVDGIGSIAAGDVDGVKFVASDQNSVHHDGFMTICFV